MASASAMTAPTVYQNFIGGEWRDSVSGTTFLDTNPAHESEVLGAFQRSTVADLDGAITAAQKAFPAWRATPAPERGEVILRAALLLEQHREELSRLLTREMGKVLKEARGDLQTAIDFGKFVAAAGRQAEGRTVPSALRDKMCLTLREPLGVVGIITPWNFPLAIPAWKTFPALVAGNAVILKPASDTPLLSLKLVEILHEAGLPPGVLNLITGPGGTLGDALASDQRVSMISLTGSTEVGQHVAEICGRDLRRVTLELGGKNAIIVMDDANLDEAAAAVAWAGFGTTGQRCTATSRVIVHRAVVDAFNERLVALAQKQKLGDGLDTAVDMGPLVNRGRVQAVDAYIDIGKGEGAKLITGGGPARGGELDQGAFFQPTVFTDVTPEMRIAREEIFGPVVAVLPVDSYDQAIAVANSTEYGLSCAIFTEDMRNAFRAMHDIQAGLIYLNAGTTGAEPHLPFGGVKHSGNGHRELGPDAIDEWSEVKTVFVSYPKV